MGHKAELPLLCLVWDSNHGEGQELRTSEHYHWALQRPRWAFGRRCQKGVTLGVTGTSWQNGCTSVLNGLGTWEGQHNIFFLLYRITWFISNMSIGSYSGSTFKHFANEFRIIIPNLQTRRLRLSQEIRPVQSRTMRQHWKVVLWDPPGPLFPEQHTWNKDISFFYYFYFNFQTEKMVRNNAVPCSLFFHSAQEVQFLQETGYNFWWCIIYVHMYI